MTPKFPSSTFLSPVARARCNLALTLRPMVRSVRAALIVAASLAVTGHCAYAQTPQASARQSYAIPAGPLKHALALFSAQAGISVSYVPGLVDGKTSPGLNGSSDMVSALTKLLAGSGLRAEARSSSTYEILRAPEPAPVPVSPVPPVADGGAAALAQLPDITVTSQVDKDLGYHDQGFVAQTTRSATRTDTPIAELAQSVQVVTQDAMRSQQAQSVADAVANVSGVTTSINNTSGTGIVVRGFAAAVTQDGNTTASNTVSSYVPLAGVERIEVLKGADSILAGTMQPGGVVNLVMKKPQSDPVHELTVQTGSYGDWLTSIDLAGALTQNKIFTYRFVMSGERVGQDTYGYDGKRDFYVAPSLGFDYGGTHLVIGLQQNANVGPGPAYTLLGPDGPYPTDTPIGYPHDHYVNHSTSVNYDLREDLSKDWVFHSTASYARSANSSATYALSALAGLPGTKSYVDGVAPTAGFYPGVYSGAYYAWNTEQSITGKIRTGPVLQTVTAGFSYGESWHGYGSGYGENIVTVPLGDGAALPPIPSGIAEERAADTGKIYDSNPYLQDQISIGRLHVLASIGHPQESGQQAAKQGSWTPNLGVLYQLTGSISVYANALRSFTPQAGAMLQSGGAAPPSTGNSVEVGAKFSLLDDRLTMTAAVFRAAVKNVLLPSPVNRDLFIVGAGDTSRGFEFDATGRLLPGLNLIGSYTYSNYVSVSNGFSQLPKHQASLWLTYDLQGERLHGWGAGVGEWVRSGYSALSPTGDIYPMPGQARTDVSLYYHAKTWSAALGVKNVFDRRLYGDYASYSDVDQEPGRLIYLTGTYNF